MLLSGGGLGVFITTDGWGVDTSVPCSDTPDSLIEGSGVVTILGGVWEPGGVATGVVIGVFTSDTCQAFNMIWTLGRGRVWLEYFRIRNKQTNNWTCLNRWQNQATFELRLQNTDLELQFTYEPTWKKTRNENKNNDDNDNNNKQHRTEFFSFTPCKHDKQEWIRSKWNYTCPVRKTQTPECNIRIALIFNLTAPPMYCLQIRFS